MRLQNFNPMRLRRSADHLAVGSRARMSLFIPAVVIGSVLVTVGVRAYNRAPLIGSKTVRLTSTAPFVQKGGKSGKDLHARLSLQPEIDRFRRRLGLRFTAPGRERSTLVGRLTIGAQQYQVRISRTQDVDGEQVEIALNGGPSLIWNDKEGAKSGGRDATGLERSLIERLALDSPDQFIMAQLRGASYYTIDRFVQPADVKDAESYDGPVWDLVRVGEPEGAAQNRSQSPWRLYYLNSATGLLDRVISQEQGATVAAEFTQWVFQGGEKLPTRIAWTRNELPVMELVINGVSHGSLQ